MRMLVNLWKDSRVKVGFIILLSLILISLFAPVLSPFELSDRSIENRLCEASTEHILGCDLNGGDVLSSLFHGGRVSLFVGIVTVSLGLFIGTFIGLLTGFFGGWFDFLFMRVVDILMAFPGILLALFMSAVLGPGIENIIIAISLTGWIGFARLVRGQTLGIKKLEHVEAARAIGVGSFPIIFRHIFPMLTAPLIVHATFSLSGVIIVESGLSFLGLGPQGDMASWGELLSQGKEVLVEAPILTLAPGLAIVLTVLSLNFLGDALRDYLDPRKIAKN